MEKVDEVKTYKGAYFGIYGDGGGEGVIESGRAREAVEGAEEFFGNDNYITAVNQ